ncbi:TPA: hypothetical protein VDV84_001783 [Pseudomonas aeruginosa]|uniref:hypothetical protein n=2 Tax=Pseudomonas aeruginosa TaxID=287 RepID=UPI00068C6C19|nr:hypothetical protein [Pseudomonas aeruginosa]EIU3127350.1 hypothetical protein [Pseudomonas aeruginosa]EKT8385483.1 hypothetical protein [Pseudomonas aeruginosa]EKT9075913.1 hypothetical protein [Pseudomonas aeruginosa]EKT9149536.1 hypothetical protein [Pseudomonas aeruginosa]EKT9155900.1 hypothetical protein [Pseudomonas aeruginosa]
MTEEEHDAKLRAEAQALREEVEKAQNALAFTEQWHGVRYERLWHWAHAELDEEQKRRYFNIVANGTAEHSEPPTYAQQLCRMKHRYECAEKEAAALRARVAVVPDGYALVPVEPTREMFIAINKEDDKAYAGGCHHGAQFEWLWDAAIEAAPRPNSLTVSEGLLRRIVTPALTSSDAHDRIGALEELRALLSEQDGGKP